MDIVPTLFVTEFLASYPDTKVILTTRKSEDAWLKSMKDTYWANYKPEPVVHLGKRLMDRCLRWKYGVDMEVRFLFFLFCVYLFACLLWFHSSSFGRDGRVGGKKLTVMTGKGKIGL